MNKKIAEKVLKSILKHPDEHRQETWLSLEEFAPSQKFIGEEHTDRRTLTIERMEEGACGTSACIAGWAALHAGWKVEEEYAISPRGQIVDEKFSLVSPKGWVDQTSSSPEFDLEAIGMAVLDMDPDDASLLFHIMDEEEAIIRLYACIKNAPEWASGEMEYVLDRIGVEFGEHSDHRDPWGLLRDAKERAMDMIHDEYGEKKESQNA